MSLPRGMHRAEVGSATGGKPNSRDPWVTDNPPVGRAAAACTEHLSSRTSDTRHTDLHMSS